MKNAIVSIRLIERTVTDLIRDDQFYPSDPCTIGIATHIVYNAPIRNNFAGSEHFCFATSGQQ